MTDLNIFLKEKLTLHLSFNLVSDRQMKKINLQFRGKNKSTNVLSFPAIDEKLIRKKNAIANLVKLPQVFLGDIVIAFETIKKESENQNKKFNDHLTHMILHSILHLIGYDHKTEKMAKVMENIEIEILEKNNINNPYQ